MTLRSRVTGCAVAAALCLIYVFVLSRGQLL